MSLSDILTVLEILITVVVGFYLAHWYSVRDSQHRAVKDYYINLLSEYQKQAEEIFRGVLSSDVSGRTLLAKIDGLESALEGFDEDLRRALPVKLKPIQESIGDVMDELTNLNDINEQFDNEAYHLGTNDIISVRQLSRAAHRWFGIYINQININHGHHVWHELLNNVKNTIEYYRGSCLWKLWLKVLWGLVCAFWVRLLLSLLFILLCVHLWNAYQTHIVEDEAEKKEQREWRKTIIHEMHEHNRILDEFDKQHPTIGNDTKNYYDCVFHRYDTCDSTIYERVK